MVLRASQRLNALAVPGPSLVDRARDRRRPHEAHRRDARMLQDPVDRRLVPVDDVEHAVGQARLLPQLGDHHRRRGILLRGLEDEGVAGRDRDRVHPHRDHDGEVERRDPGGDPQRLPDRPAVHVRRDVLRELPLEELRDPARELHHLEPSLHLATGVGEHLSVLAHDRAGELVRMPTDELPEPEQDVGARSERGSAPLLERPFRRRHRPIDVGGARQRDLSGRDTRRRVEQRPHPLAGAGIGAAVDPVRQAALPFLRGPHGSRWGSSGVPLPRGARRRRRGSANDQ